MFRAHRAHATLAALLFLCAQGCRTRADAPRAALLTQQSPSAPAAPEPTPHAPPFPARQTGDEAFESFINLSGGRRFESHEVKRKPLRKDLRVRADYPVLLGDYGSAAREFNRRARAFVMENVTPYLVSDPDPEKNSYPHWKDVEEYYNVSHKVVYASDEVVSVLFYVDEYHWGAGHGMHQPVAFNFDLRTGREINLARIFKPGSDYLRRITSHCAADLLRQREAGHIHGGGYSRPEDLEPKAKNFDAWVVTPGGLVFIFEEYEVAPYADGEPKVLIPFDQLREFIDPRGALARLAAAE